MTKHSSDRFFDNNADDVRGWPVRDANGRDLGNVKELLADPDSEFVTSVVLDTGRQLRAHDLEISDGALRLKAVEAAAMAPAPRPAATAARAEAAAATAARAEATAARPASAPATPRAAPSRYEDIVVQLVDEELDVGKRRYDAGGVHVETHVVSEPFAQDVRLAEEHVTCERKKVDRPLDATNAANLLHDETFEVTSTAQVPVVNKISHVVEEIVIRKDAVDRDETVRDTVRHMEADITELRAEEALRASEAQRADEALRGARR